MVKILCGWAWSTCATCIRTKIYLTFYKSYWPGFNMPYILLHVGDRKKKGWGAHCLYPQKVHSSQGWGSESKICIYVHLWCLFQIIESTEASGDGMFNQFSSVAQSCLTLQSYGLQHARLPCPSPTPGDFSNSCPSSLWCHPTISSSAAIPFSSCLQSLPASGSFQMSQFFASGGQSIGVSALASVLPMNIQYWFPLWLTGWKSLLQHNSSKASILQHSAFFIVQFSHPYMSTGKIALTTWTFVGKVMFLFFNMLSRLVIAFLARSKHLLISWVQSPSAVISEPRK